MKALLVALTLVVSSSAFATSFQTHEEFAIQEFNKSTGVKYLNAEAKKAGLTVDDTKAVLLSGQCGFAGCSRVFLVSQSISRKGINVTTDSINAIVTIPAHASLGNVKVSAAFDSSLLLEELKELNQ